MELGGGAGSPVALCGRSVSLRVTVIHADDHWLLMDDMLVTQQSPDTVTFTV